MQVTYDIHSNERNFFYSVCLHLLIDSLGGNLELDHEPLKTLPDDQKKNESGREALLCLS